MAPPIADTNVAATSPCTAIGRTSASAGGLFPEAPRRRHLPPGASAGPSGGQGKSAEEPLACAGRKRKHPWDLCKNREVRLLASGSGNS